MQFNHQVEKEEHINESGFNTDWTKYIATIEPNQYIIDKELAESLGGDQPKTFIKLNEHGITGESDPKNWTGYIAKFPRKWYPNEAITEHLLTSIGEVMGMQMATSKLAIINGQVRFLSRYFLRPKERLMHGAEVYTNYKQDKTIIGDNEEVDLEGKPMPYEFTINAINKIFPDNAASIVEAFHKMLIFDAFIGVNDRHPHNWGVIINTKQDQTPVFSPLYDTSRALFWNISEKRLSNLCVSEKSQSDFLIKYMNKSMPKITTYDTVALNHFELLKILILNNPQLINICSGFIENKVIEDIITIIEKDFKNLFSSLRLTLLQKLLRERFNRIEHLLNKLK